MPPKLQNRAVNLVATLRPALSGQSATFTLTKVTGTTVSKTLITDPQGMATAQFALNKTRDKPGMYYGSVSLLIDGQSITGSTSISIK